MSGSQFNIGSEISLKKLKTIKSAKYVLSSSGNDPVSKIAIDSDVKKDSTSLITSGAVYDLLYGKSKKLASVIITGTPDAAPAIDYDEIYEPIIDPKNTGFNLPLGITSGSVAFGNHTHSGTLLDTDNAVISGVWSFIAQAEFGLAPYFSAPSGAPMTVDSATMVANLNADRVDGYHASQLEKIGHTHTAYPVKSGTEVMSGNWTFNSSSNLTFDMVPAFNTPAANPFTVVSTQKVTNLNADLLDGLHSSSFSVSGHGHAWSTITNKPTTLSGYGITDAYTGTYIDDNFQSKSTKYTKTDVDEIITGKWSFHRNGENMIIKGTSSADSAVAYIRYRDSAGTSLGYVGYGSSSNGALYIMNQRVGGSIYLGTNSTNRMTMTSTGATTFTSTVTATNFYESSDRKLKKEICPISSRAFAKATKVEYVQYRLKKEGSHLQYGVVANDLEKQFPELVTKDANGVRGVDYRSLFILQLNKQQQEINELKVLLNQRR